VCGERDERPFHRFIFQLCKEIHMKSSQRVTLALCVAAALTSGVAMAADNGVYVGGSVGQGRPTFGSESLSGGTGLSTEKSATAWKGFVGYQIDKTWGVELNAMHLGTYDVSAPALGTSGSARINGMGADLVGTMPITNGVSLLGKVGAIRTSERINGSVGSATEKQWSPKLGVGLKYDINERLSARVELEHINKIGSAANTIDTRANVYSAGLAFKF